MVVGCTFITAKKGEPASQLGKHVTDSTKLGDTRKECAALAPFFLDGNTFSHGSEASRCQHLFMSRNGLTWRLFGTTSCCGWNRNLTRSPHGVLVTSAMHIARAPCAE